MIPLDIETAVVDLQRQSLAHGLGGALDDIQVHLCEDGKTIAIWAFYDLLPDPLCTTMKLPRSVTSIDSVSIRHAVECAAEQPQDMKTN